jgi:hypothetical protein
MIYRPTDPSADIAAPFGFRYNLRGGSRAA